MAKAGVQAKTRKRGLFTFPPPWYLECFLSFLSIGVYGETNFGADESGTLVGTGRLEVQPTNLQVGPLDFGKKALGRTQMEKGNGSIFNINFPRA